MPTLFISNGGEKKTTTTDATTTIFLQKNSANFQTSLALAPFPLFFPLKREKKKDPQVWDKYRWGLLLLLLCSPGARAVLWHPFNPTDTHCFPKRHSIKINRICFDVAGGRASCVFMILNANSPFFFYWSVCVCDDCARVLPFIISLIPRVFGRLQT